MCTDTQKKTLSDILALFNCNKPFVYNGKLSKRATPILNDVITALEMASVISECTTIDSYKAYYAIYKLRQLTKGANICSLTNDDIDKQQFSIICKSLNFNLLKTKLTAFEMLALNRLAYEYDLRNKYLAHRDTTKFINKYTVDKLVSFGKIRSPYYTIAELFDTLHFHKPFKPFLATPRVVNKNTDDEHIEYLSYSGKKVYNNLIEVINIMHNAFDFPDIADALDSIIDREWY